MADESEVLRLTVPNRRRDVHDCKLDFTGFEPWRDEHIVYRPARTAANRLVCLKIADGGGKAVDLLRQEVAIGERLLRKYPVGLYPPELAELVGFNLDDEKVYLVSTFNGEPLDRLTGRIPVSGEFFAKSCLSLAVALRHLEAQGIVCRAISPRSLAWLDGALQLTDFTQAALRGAADAPRVDRGPWSAPEQRRGADRPDIRGDVFSMAQVLLWLHTGADPEDAVDMVGRLRRADGEMRHLLDGAFGPLDGRPSPLSLLQRLGAPDPCRGAGQRDELEHAARERFRRARDNQDAFLRGLEAADRRARDALARRQALARQLEQEARRRQELRRAVLLSARLALAMAVLITVALLVNGAR